MYNANIFISYFQDYVLIAASCTSDNFLSVDLQRMPDAMTINKWRYRLGFHRYVHNKYKV